MTGLRLAKHAKSTVSPLAGLIAFSLLATPSAFGQTHSLDVSQYQHTSWTAQDGFFKGGIQSVAQTSDGYIWVTSISGLLRFDGVRFFEWKSSGKDSLPGQPLHKLLGSRDGSLWIAGYGLAELKATGEFRRYHELDALEIDALIEDKEGAIWAGGTGAPNTSTLCRIYGGKSECFLPTGSLPSSAGPLYEDGKGQLWVCTPYGIWQFRPGPPHKFAPNSDELRAFGEDANDTLIFSNGSHMLMLTADGKVKDYPIPLDKAVSILKDREGDLWVGTSGQGILHVHKGRTDRFTTVDGLSFDLVYAIFQDREGNVWVATENGLDKFTKPAVPRMTRKQGLANDDIFSVLADRNGVSWVGTSSGLSKLVDGSLIPANVKLPNSTVTSLFETSEGRMLVATGVQNGMVWLDGDKTTPLRAQSGENVFEVAEGSNGDLWVASRELGLLHLSSNGHLIENFGRKVLKRFGISIAYDPKRDGVWLTSYLGDLGFFKEGKFAEKYGTADGLGNGVVRDPQVDMDGGVWVGTRVGLAHLMNGKISVLSRKNGLPCDAVHWMRHDEDHNVWLYTECGLVSFAEGELNAWITQPSHAVVVTHYLDNTDGVENLSYNGWYTPQTATTNDGRILFATTTALSILDPRNLSQNIQPPPVHIEEITADGREVEGSGRASLPARVHSLHIAYTALSFSAPRKIRFRYKLQGYDTDWSPPVSLREATYTNLPPGNYKFLVIACNNDGVWNNEGATLDFRIPPAWFQTIWFRILCLAATLVMLWSIYRLRVRQIAAAMSGRFDERLAERTRIARELHDTLLQTIQGSKLVASNALKNADDPVRTRRALEQLSEWLVRATDEGRAALHSLRTSTIETNDLAAGLRRALEDCRREPSMETVFDVKGNTREMHPIVRDEIYLIGYEAIRNAHAHSAGGRIDVTLTYADDLSLSVRDDGIGINSVIAEAGKDGHFGLPSMRERSARIGGRLTIETSANHGTEIKIVIPGSLAFRRPRPSPLDKVKAIFDRVDKN